MTEPDFPALWKHLERRFALGRTSLHGPEHWRRVEQHGLRLAEETAGADLLVVELFAVFHDAERYDEGTDLGHGPRAADLVRRMHGTWFELAPHQLDTLALACRHHADGDTSDDPTIGCCWDADRLDLPRVGIQPEAEFMSTERGRRLTRRPTHKTRF